MSDVYGPATTLSLYDRWLTKSAEYLLKTYSIHPPHDAEGQKGRALVVLNGDKDITHRKMGGDRKVARLHLERGERGQIAANEGGDALYGVASYADASPGPTVYWLPWDDSGAIIQLTIPAKGTRGRGKTDPDRFFTAAINGCSIFFTGTAQNPTVYHAGGDTGQTGPAAQAKFWRDLMGRLGHAGAAEINKEDYIKNSAVMVASQYSTQAIKDYRAWLENQYSQMLEIEDVRPWACVMGIRDATGAWKFYLQENASVSYYTLRKKKRTFQKDTMAREKEATLVVGNQTGIMIDRKRTVARPIRVTEIFPTRTTSARVDQPIPRVRHG